MNGNTGIVPKLRFPEFRDAGEWEEIKLIDVADKKIKWSFIGGPFGSNLKSSDYVADGIRIIQLQNIGDAEFFDNYKIFTSEEKADELLANNIYPGEIILSKMGDPVGRACLIPNKHTRYIMCSDGIRLVVDEKVFSKYFIYTLINSIQFRALVEKTATGSTRKRIGLDNLKNLPMVVPKKKEQQKIADCLSSIDELITAQTQQLDALKTHKKGLMQQLFPAEGETLPKLRFPEFRDAGEWEEKKLSVIAELTSSKRVHLSDYVPHGIPFFRGKEISLLKNNQIPEDILFISNEHYEEIKEKYGVPEIGDILITAVGTLGNVYCIRNSNKFYFKDGNLIWMKNISENSIFIELLLNVKSKYVLSSAIGSSQKALTMVELNKLKFSYPKKEEQQKIADCFSSIDELIAAVSQKINALKTHKKGLMQQLFPSADEVAG